MKYLSDIDRGLKWIILLSVIPGFMGCSSSSTSSEDRAPPRWIQQSTRTVDQGYIVYVAVAEDRSIERAFFKAESQAIEDIANECSFPPKGSRLEDRFDDTVGILHRVYVKMALTYEECDAAQQASNPEKVRELASIPMTEELKRYQDLVETENGDSQEVASADSTGSGDGSVSNVGAASTIHTSGQYFVARQQVAYMKEVVILSPPGAYPPGAPRTIEWSRNVSTVSQQVHNYNQEHPEIRSSSNSWSGYRSQTHVQTQRPMALRRMQVRETGRPMGQSGFSRRRGGSFGRRGRF